MFNGLLHIGKVDSLGMLTGKQRNTRVSTLEFTS